MTTTPATAPAATASTPAVDTNLLRHEDKVFFKYVTINSADTMQRFTSDLRVMSAHAQRIMGIAQRIQSAITGSEKEALTRARDAELKDFNDKDALFEKVYGFKADHVTIRPNLIQNTSIRLLTPVNDEQIATLRKDPNFKESDIIARGNAKVLQLSVITGGEIPVLERNIQIVQAQQNAVIQLTAAEQSAKTEDEKKRVKDELAKVKQTLTTNAEHMGKTYGIVTNNLIVEVLEGVFWVAMTEEELKNYLQKRDQAKPATAAAPAPAAPAAKAAPAAAAAPAASKEKKA
jgi:hypothetical protein